MSDDNITTEQDLKQAFMALWEEADEKIEEFRDNFKRDLLRDIMELVIAKRDAGEKAPCSKNWFNGLMREAADIMSRADLGLSKTPSDCYIELWEMLGEEIGDLVPTQERGAWFAQATDDGGWIEFDEGLVQKAA